MARKRKPKTDADEPRFPLKVTELQRKALIHATRLRSKIKARFKDVGDGTQVILFTKKDLSYLTEEIGTAAVYAPDPDRKRLVAVKRKIEDLLDTASEKAATSKRRQPTNKADLLCQFRIALLDIKPPIWRRIQVEDCTLAELHEYIQAAFGWWNYHLHQFEIDGARYGPLPEDDFDYGVEMEDETAVRLSDLLPKSGKRTRWIYEYDFGDGWRHEVRFEGYPPKAEGQEYPVCLEGERACPPEDVGGPWGYVEYLEVLADSDHERHEELLEWRGPFDPEAFDAKQATAAMRKVKRPNGA